MTEEPNHLDIAATLDRMETGVAPMPIEMSLASIAVSLKRIADDHNFQSSILEQVHHEIFQYTRR